MLKAFKITNLFGQFNYDLQLFNSGITILTGPNGFGKSTILKIIEAIGEKDLYELTYFQFDDLFAILDNGKELHIVKNQDFMSVNEVSLKIPNKRVIENLERRREVPFIERIGPREYIDLRDNTILSFEEVQEIRMHYERDRIIKDRLIYLNLDIAKRSKTSQAPLKSLDKFLYEFKKDMGPIKFIKEQRLLRKEVSEEEYYSHKKEIAVEVINEIPEKIKNEIKNVVLKYSEVSSQLDSSFPKRLFSTKDGISQKDYLENLGELILRQEKVQVYKLLNDFKNFSTDYIETYSQALRVYLQDTKQKLEVFDDLIRHLDVFTDIVNKKLNFKRIAVSNEKGLMVLRDDGTELDASKLSSGEQQIIVLYYELIFGVKDKLMLLIDEPEISLHVAWQRELLNDFHKIIDLKNGHLNILIATHAPQVIDNNWDLVIDLGEKYGVR